MYEKILERAINLCESDNTYNLFDAITDIISEIPDIDYEEFSMWLRKNKPLLECLKNDVKHKRLYNEKDKNEVVDLEMYFQ